jgi:hypothetical protein
MWYEVVFENTDANRGIEICYQLRNDGLVQGVDWNWKYIPAPKSVTLMFRDQAMTTFYALKCQIYHNTCKF